MSRVLEVSYLEPLEKFKGPEMVAGGETIELPNEVENIGDGINGGKPVLEVIGKFIGKFGKFNGKGELNGTVVGDTLGDAGEPEKGVREVGGVVALPG